MAMFSDTHHPVRESRVRNALRRFYDILSAVGEAQSRRHAFVHYQKMTDEELAAKGLRRDEIARHVFRDILYL